MPHDPAAAPPRSRRIAALMGALGLVHLALLLLNAVRVPATYGYDWPGHFTYLYHVAETGRVPPPEVSAQFFNPPLYYFAVAAFQRLTRVPLLHAGHLFNLMVAVVTFALWAGLCRRLWRDRPVPFAWCVGLYVFNPTLYRAFGMVRPEALLLPLFVAAAWLVVAGAGRVPRWPEAVGAGALAGLAFGVRQWGAFLALALALWLWVEGGRRATTAAARWRSRVPVAVHGATFAALAGLVLLLRGGAPLAFNATAHPPDARFLTDLALPALFSRPVRPALNGRFWPVLYADFWGDYWRYWREALWHDPLPSSPATVAALARAMGAALPATALAVAGLLLRVQDRRRSALQRFARALFAVSLPGFLLFASLYADPGKGDTVKSVYVVYWVPFVAWGAGLAAQRLAGRGGPWARGAVLLPLAAVAALVAPLAIYRPPARMQSRTWTRPEVAHPIDVAFGPDLFTLVGYTVAHDAAAGTLDVTLVWRADGYAGRSYKVFVHLLGPEGRPLAQSDAVPARWLRPTYAWMLGEYIVDPHRLAVPDGVPEGARLAVGLYDAGSGERLRTLAGADRVTLAPTQDR